VKQLLVILVLALSLTACGAKIQEKAVEKLTEKVIEQSTGLKDVDVSVDENSSSFTTTDEDGNQIKVSTNKVEKPDSFSGFGFDIPLPDSVSAGSTQEIEKDGEVVMVQAQYDTEGFDPETFYTELHNSLTASGFVYNDDPESPPPDPSSPTFIPILRYAHEDGYFFQVIADDSAVIMSLIKANTEE